MSEVKVMADTHSEHSVQNVSLEQVGLAEATLQRLIDERRALIDATSALATYRAALADLETVQHQLALTQQKVYDEQEALAVMVADHKQAIEDMEAAQQKYAQQAHADLQEALKDKQAELLLLTEHIDDAKDELQLLHESIALQKRLEQQRIEEAQYQLEFLLQQQEDVRNAIAKIVGSAHS